MKGVGVMILSWCRLMKGAGIMVPSSLIRFCFLSKLSPATILMYKNKGEVILTGGNTLFWEKDLSSKIL